VGGFVFMGYDNDVTGEFINKVYSNYGAYVAEKIVKSLINNLT